MVGVLDHVTRCNYCRENEEGLLGSVSTCRSPNISSLPLHFGPICLRQYDQLESASRYACRARVTEKADQSHLFGQVNILTGAETHIPQELLLP